MRIGILALQGAFIEHAQMLDRLGADHFEIRCREDLDRPMDGLIIPGGESTVMAKLLRELGMHDKLKDMIESGLPVFGTCAGMIVLAQTLGDGTPGALATLPMKVQRNAYGRQLASFNCTAPFADVGDVPMEFIRAPYVMDPGDCDVLAKDTEGHIVAVRKGNQIATAFHPELTECTAVHRYFLEMAAAASAPNN